MTHGLYHLVPIGEVIENPSNPRRAMDKAAAKKKRGAA